MCIEMYFILSKDIDDNLKIEDHLIKEDNIEERIYNIASKVFKGITKGTDIDDKGFYLIKVKNDRYDVLLKRKVTEQGYIYNSTYTNTEMVLSYHMVKYDFFTKPKLPSCNDGYITIGEKDLSLINELKKSSVFIRMRKDRELEEIYDL